MNLTLEPHPLALEYPPHSDDEVDRVAKQMKQFGFDVRFPIVLFQSKILDGAGLRYPAAMKAGIQPEYVVFDGNEEQAKRFVKIANEDRRHLTKDWLSVRQAVLKAASDGKPSRAIAEEIGISKTTVLNHIKAAQDDSPGPADDYSAPESNGTLGKPHEANGAAPKPTESVKGRDGKDHPRHRKPKKPRSKNGKAAVSVAGDRKIVKLMGQLARAIDDRAGATGKTKLYKGCAKAMDDLSEAWEAWQGEQK